MVDSAILKEDFGLLSHYVYVKGRSSFGPKSIFRPFFMSKIQISTIRNSLVQDLDFWMNQSNCHVFGHLGRSSTIFQIGQQNCNGCR